MDRAEDYLLGGDLLMQKLGATWPEVDQNLYAEVAASLRAFADDLADDGQLANTHLVRLLSTGSGQSFDALNVHWNAVLGRSFADIVSASYVIASAMDQTAVEVAATKSGIAQHLYTLTARIGVVTSQSVFTFGDTSAGAAAMQAAATAIASLNRNCAAEASRLLAAASADPSVAAVQAITPDRLRASGTLEGGAAGGNAIAAGAGVAGATGGGADGIAGGAAVGGGGGTGGVAGAGAWIAGGGAGGGSGMHLASAGGGIGGLGSGLVDLEIDHDEHDRASGKLSVVSTGIHGRTSSALGSAAAHHARNRGRGAIAHAVDPHADRLLGALEDATGHMGDHIGRTLPKAIKQISVDYRNTDDAVRAAFARIHAPSPAPSPSTPKAPDAAHGATADGLGHHRTEPLRVHHLAEPQQRAVSAEEAHALADRARTTD